MIAEELPDNDFPSDASRLIDNLDVESDPCLERLISRETVAEILAAMTARQLSVALLRCDGLSDAEIAARLGITEEAVRQRLERARRRIMARIPETRSFLSDDRQRRLAVPPHLLTPSDPEEHVGLAELARDVGLTAEGVRLRVLAGRYPSASRDEHGWWRVPRGDAIPLPGPDLDPAL